jgi:hypothetical protein
MVFVPIRSNGSSSGGLVCPHLRPVSARLNAHGHLSAGVGDDYQVNRGHTVLTVDNMEPTLP